MPTYSYQCSSCKKPYSEVRSINDEQIKISCDDCNGSLIRKYEVQGISFKGDGFYSNDKKTQIDLNI